MQATLTYKKTENYVDFTLNGKYDRDFLFSIYNDEEHKELKIKRRESSARVLIDPRKNYIIKSKDKSVFISDKVIKADEIEPPFKLKLFSYELNEDNTIALQFISPSTKDVKVIVNPDRGIVLEENEIYVHKGEESAEVKVHSIREGKGKVKLSFEQEEVEINIVKRINEYRVKRQDDIEINEITSVYLPLAHIRKEIRTPFEEYIVSDVKTRLNTKIKEANDILVINIKDVNFLWKDEVEKIKILSQDKNKKAVINHNVNPLKKNNIKPIIKLAFEERDIHVNSKVFPLEFVLDREIKEEYWVRLLINEKEYKHKLNYNNKKFIIPLPKEQNKIELVECSSNIEIENNNYPYCIQSIKELSTFEIDEKRISKEKIVEIDNRVLYKGFDFYGNMNNVIGNINGEKVEMKQEMRLWRGIIKKSVI